MKTTPSVITSLLAHIASECRAVDREAAFRVFLDDGPEVSVGSLSWEPSRVLEAMDPIAFSEGVNDYADGMDWTEVDGETYEDREIEAARESFLNDLQSALDDLEAQLANAEDNNDSDTAKDLGKDITAKRAELAEIEGYSF